MAFSLVTCTYCCKNYLKDNRYITGNLKIKNNFYCSSQCQYSFKNKQIEFICERLGCGKRFKRAPNDISPHNYCSRSCAVTINNKKFPKSVAGIRNCVVCGNRLFNQGRYCSVDCKSSVLTISKKRVIERIMRFYQKNKRIPFKREMWGIYKPARKYFGTWNSAIIAAGFKSNPVMFASHHIAKDGHRCYSLAEKIIDDYLFRHNIQHERSIPYPESECTVDFKIGEKWIEYFGLAGEHKRYDQLRKQKQRMAKKFKLNLIEIYPKDLFKDKQLDSFFNI